MSYSKQKMTSNKPYLLRAFHEWILDNQMTPYIVINAEILGVKVPRQFVENGQIILNISSSAVDMLLIDNTRIEFKASFGGVVQQVLAPISAVNAIYAKETGQGMVFVEEEDTPPLPPLEEIGPVEKETIPEESKKESKTRSHLRIIK